MAVEIHEDLVNGHVYHEDDRGGNLDRLFVVTGLASNSAITEAALRAVDGGRIIPKGGENHPTLPEFRVREIIIESFNRSTSQMRIIVRYVKRRRRLLDIRINGVSTYQDAFIDQFGKRMRVGWMPPTADNSGKLVPAPANKAFPDATVKNIDAGYRYATFSTPKQVAELTMEVIYYELSSPFKTNLKYARRLNSKPFMGCPARTWYLENVGGTIDSPIPTNMGKLGNPRIVTGPALFDWVTSYFFRFRPRPQDQIDSEGWDPLAVFKDPRSGEIPIDIEPTAGKWPKKTRGNGWGQFEVVGEIDFNDLQLASGVEEDPDNPLNQKK